MTIRRRARGHYLAGSSGGKNMLREKGCNDNIVRHSM